LTHFRAIEISSVEVRGHVVVIRRDDLHMFNRGNVSGTEVNSTLRYIGTLKGSRGGGVKLDYQVVFFNGFYQNHYIFIVLIIIHSDDY